jgi:protein-tyrosine phosphatase
MSGYIDLHCHWVAGIDDGARALPESLAMLAGLKRIGFSQVFATPHMRPGMFDNTKENITSAFEKMLPQVDAPEMPSVALSCEHYFDDIVFQRIMNSGALPYPGNKAILVEFSYESFPARILDRFFDLRRKGLRPVVAHPERYSPVRRAPESMEEFVDRGIVLLLDTAALAGKYGRSVRKTAEYLLDAGLYYAACSDAHHPDDISAVNEGIQRMKMLIGSDETVFLLREGPKAILEGKVDL